MRQFTEVTNDVVSAIYDDAGNKIAEAQCVHELLLDVCKHFGVSLDFVQRWDIDDFPDHIRDLPEELDEDDDEYDDEDGSHMCCQDEDCI